MTQKQVTFADKVNSKTPTVPAINDIRDVDMNELKNVANDNAVDTETRFAPVGNLLGSGVVEGGFITTIPGSTTYDIAAGSGYVVDNYTNSDAPVVTPVSWIAKTGITPKDLTTKNTQFIGIDSAGGLLEFDTLPSEIDKRDFIYLGKLLIDEATDTTVIGLTFPRMEYAVSDQLNDLTASVGIINIIGNDITANGANLSLDRAEGVTYRVGANYPNGYKNPSTITTPIDTAFTFGKSMRDGSGGFVSVQGTSLDPNFYDDGSGTLQPVPASSFTIQRVYFFTNGNSFITYGQVLYESFNAAINGIVTECPIVEEQFTGSLRPTHHSGRL